jgi:hypothetical protein
VNGFSLPIRSSNKELFCKYLVDLHEVPGKISHQEPLLGVFHEPLLYCVKGFLDLERKQKVDTGLLSTLLVKIVKTWPSAFMGNSPKEILFLHELSLLLYCASQFDGHPRVVIKDCPSLERQRSATGRGRFGVVHGTRREKYVAPIDPCI